MKLIKVFETQVQTKSEYLQKLHNEDNIQVYPDNQQAATSSKLTITEEKALLLFTSLCRKTSVIFDVQSLCELLKKEENEHRAAIISNLIFNAMGYMNAMKGQLSKDQHYAFSKYWDAAISFLKLSTLNEMLQTFRVNEQV